MRDVIVVGAGPGGAVAAYELSRAGMSVLLVDRATFPRWKVCGACLSPGALAMLEAADLGDLCGGLRAVPLETLALSARSGTARLPLRGSVALSRAAFDSALVEAAVEQGAEFCSDTRASLGTLGKDHRRVHLTRAGIRREVRARVVIDATGLGPGLTEDGRPASEGARHSMVGLGATYEDADYPIQPGELRLSIGRGGYVGVVRLEDGALNVAAAVRPDVLRRSSPDRVVARVLAEAGREPLGAAPGRGWRGTPPLTRASHDVGGARLLRLGDAAGYVEPFTGEGMCWAISGARAAAGLARLGVARWSPGLANAWCDYHHRAMRRGQRLCRTLVLGLRRPWLVAAAVRLLQAAPALGTPFVRGAARAPVGPELTHS